MDAIIGLFRMSVGGVYKKGKMNGFVWGKFDILFKEFVCGWENWDLSVLYHLGGLRNLLKGNLWNNMFIGRKVEQSHESNCSKKSIECFLSRGIILKYWFCIMFINGTLPPLMLKEEMKEDEGWHDRWEEIINVTQAAVIFLLFNFVGSSCVINNGQKGIHNVDCSCFSWMYVILPMSDGSLIRTMKFVIIDWHCSCQ
jgi:hypothetical protein